MSSLVKVSRDFVNEYGEQVTLEVIFAPTSVTVTITTEGHRRLADDLLTPRERVTLRELLDTTQIEPGYKPSDLVPHK